MTALASDWLKHFQLIPWNGPNRSTDLMNPDRKQVLNAISQFSVFGWSKTKDSRPRRSVNKGGKLYSSARCGRLGLLLPRFTPINRSTSHFNLWQTWFQFPYKFRSWVALFYLHLYLEACTICQDFLLIWISFRAMRLSNKLLEVEYVEEPWRSIMVDTGIYQTWNSPFKNVPHSEAWPYTPCTDQINFMIEVGFLAHLSQRLKWAIVIAHRPSVRRRPS